MNIVAFIIALLEAIRGFCGALWPHALQFILSHSFSEGEFRLRERLSGRAARLY